MIGAVPPEMRLTVRLAVFEEWLRMVPSVMERLGSSPEQLAAREARAQELRGQFEALAPEPTRSPAGES